MSKSNKVISADLKRQILERVKEGVSISQIAQEHGISNRTIYGWLSKGATAAPTWLEYNRLKRENQALKELVGVLTYEKSMAQKKN
jgi:transposase-like protein